MAHRHDGYWEYPSVVVEEELPMKAIVYHTYGSPDVLQCEDVVKPVPSDNQVLIRVRAASLNPLDVGLMKGQPYFARFFFGFPKPKVTRPGRDIAGEVEAVGGNVTRFKPGDAVFGACAGKGWMDKVDGAFAEYACTSDTALAANRQMLPSSKRPLRRWQD
jgi:NADPH:quinone reductase-like Zn-dependent oxidoreductase